MRLVLPGGSKILIHKLPSRAEASKQRLERQEAKEAAARQQRRMNAINKPVIEAEATAAEANLQHDPWQAYRAGKAKQRSALRRKVQTLR